MRRFNYPQNFTAQAAGRFGALLPLSFMDCAPGDTISGKATVNLWSDTTFRPIMNRTYFDTWAFYVPYRLLWDGFTDFIKNPDSGFAPVNTDPQAYFFEHATNTDGNCTVWNRRAYQLIWNKFFRPQSEPEADLNSPLWRPVSQRETHWHESGLTQTAVSDTTVPVVDGDVSIDSLRRGFSEDRFRKIREMYGDKYSDYLASMGVKTPWTLLDEPEFIGKMSKDFQYSNTNSAFTGEETMLGDSAGYFKNKIIQNIRPTFCPEHGIILILGAARMDLPNIAGNIHPLMDKTIRDAYYMPEMEVIRTSNWNPRLWGDQVSNPFSVYNQQRVYEDYRKPSNIIGSGTDVTNPELLYTATREDTTVDCLKTQITIPDTDYDKLFTGSMGGGTADVHYGVYTENRLYRKSPVKPPERISGVA